MTTKKIQLDACPVNSCDAAVSHAVVTTDGTKLTTQNMKQDRTCLHPTTHDGEPASYIVFHDHLEDGHAEPERVRDDADEQDEEEDGDDTSTTDGGDEHPGGQPADEIDSLSDNSAVVYETVREKQPITESTLAGQCVANNLSPTSVKGIAEALEKRGLLEDADDGYRVA